MAGSPRVVPTGGCCRSVEPKEGRNWHRELDKRIPIQGVVGDLGVRAGLTARDVAAERCGAAALDCAHHLELAEAYVTGVGVTPRGPAVAEDVRDLQSRPGHEPGRYAAGSGLLAISGLSRSSGLMTARIVLVATRV